MKVKAHEIKKALSNKHHQDFFLTEVKNGPTHFSNELLIMDAMAIKKSWANPCITGYEIKVSRSDFLRDEKWTAYLQQCHRFSFVCPKDLIKPEELPDGVGLIYFNTDKKTLYTKRKSKYREIEMNADMFYYIIMSRLDNERHPFFSSQRELIQDFLADKGSRFTLANSYKHKLAKQTEEADERAKEAEREMERYKGKAENFDTVVQIFKDNGINIHRWNWEDNLRETLESKMPPDIKRIIGRLTDDIKELERFGG